MLIRIIKEGRTRYSIRFAVVSVFVLATSVTAALAIGLHWYFSRAMAIDAALGEYQLTASRTAEYLREVDRGAMQTTAILSAYPDLIDGHWVAQSTRQLFAKVMENTPLYYAVYIGFANGDFYELINLNTSYAVREQLKAAETDRWVVIRVAGEGEARQRHFDYYDASFALRVTRAERSEYFAHQRIWYTSANEDTVNKTPPYMFQHLQAPGQTYSIRIPGTEAVLAVDIALSSLSEYLAHLQLSSPGEFFLFQSGGEVLASARQGLASEAALDLPPLVLTDSQHQYLQTLGKVRFSNETNWPPVDFSVMGEPHGYTVDFIRLIARTLNMPIEFVNGYTWPELVNLFEQQEFEVLQPVFASDQNRARGLLSEPILQLPYALVSTENTAKLTQLKQVYGKTLAIPEGWSIIPVLRERHPDIELQIVPSTRHALEAVAGGRAFATLDSAAILRYAAEVFFIDGLRFHELANAEHEGLPDHLHLLVSHRHPQLLELLNAALAHIGAEPQEYLRQKWLTEKATASTAINPVVPYRQLIWQAENASRHDLIERFNSQGCDCFSYVTQLNPQGQTQEYFAIVASTQQVLAPALTKVKLSLGLTLVCLLTLTPLCWWFASPIVRPIKRLSAENDKIKHRQYNDVQLSDSRILEIYDLSRSIADMSCAIQKHEQDQQALMDSFIKLIAQAIDDKSPYTGGHCARVPELAQMLAKAAEQCDRGPFRDFQFKSVAEWREFSVAAWLHDCGKITTPEHIVDKSTKLETIYNRIHEVRLRFEILRRDAHIDYWQKVAADASCQTEHKQTLDATCKQLEEDFAFVARCNIGSENLADEDIKRLHQLAGKTWTRHFSNRLGLSHNELKRFRNRRETLPVTETLLTDRPEHIILREEGKGFDPTLNIRMEVPKYLYNLGELYNLSVKRGTLTTEDRFKINEHMISTVKMLESLSFPAELARVPKYASTHHETLLGTGYPRRLTAEDLQIPDRILAIADIYEALTAADRPYKEAKPISEAISILHGMVGSGKLCADTFELFLSSGVYLQYAQRYLKPEQIDVVDTARYIRRQPLRKTG